MKVSIGTDGAIIVAHANGIVALVLSPKEAEELAKELNIQAAKVRSGYGRDE